MSKVKKRKDKKKGKLLYDESYKKSKLIDYVITIDILACVFAGFILYNFVFRKILSWLQIKLFSNSGTIIFTPSLGLWLMLEYTFSILYLSALLIYISFRFINNTRIKSFRTKETDKKGIKVFFIYFSYLSLIFVLISFFSYCRIGSNGVDIREIRTLFIERHYNWNEVKSVDIESYHTNKSNVFKYVIKFGNYGVNIMNAGVLMSREEVEKKLFTIQKTIKENGIPVSKKLEFVDDDIIRFMKYLGE